MVIDLRQAFLSDRWERELAYEMDLSEVELDGVKPFCAPVKVRARLQSFAGSVLVEAELDFSVTMPCDRCCDLVTREFSPRFSHTVVRELVSGEDEDLIVAPEERLDLDGLLTEDILLDMPSKFLCKPDCKGLCPVCGKNRNREDCSCQRQEGDPRLAALRQLLEDR